MVREHKMYDKISKNLYLRDPVQLNEQISRPFRSRGLGAPCFVKGQNGSGGYGRNRRVVVLPLFIIICSHVRAAMQS